jgi:hypothetical protein
MFNTSTSQQTPRKACQELDDKLSLSTQYPILMKATEKVDVKSCHTKVETNRNYIYKTNTKNRVSSKSLANKGLKIVTVFVYSLKLFLQMY